MARTSTRPTVASTNARLDGLEASLAALIEQVGQIHAHVTASQPAAVASTPAPVAEEEPKFEIAAMREKRLARREATALGGLTKAERSALWAANPQIAKIADSGKRAKAWAKVVAAYKAAN